MVWYGVCVCHLLLLQIAFEPRESRDGEFLLKSNLLQPPPPPIQEVPAAHVFLKNWFFDFFSSFHFLIPLIHPPTAHHPPIQPSSPFAVHPIHHQPPTTHHPTTSKNATDPPLLRLDFPQARARQQHPSGTPLHTAPATTAATTHRGANAHWHAHGRRAQEEQVCAGQKGAQDYRQPNQDTARREGQAQRGRDRRAQGEREERAGLFGDGEGLLREELLVVLRVLLLLLLL
ncbi:hypothetical protein DFP73DRAFT_129791 [Morchella snyderi]|nr:hypothetical protein DFP73DRAFT_129791 [Morchella snyderi]